MTKRRRYGQPFLEELAADDPHRDHASGLRRDLRTLLLGSVGYENKANERGERLIWLDMAVVDRLRSLRGLGASFSNVILRIAERQGAGSPR